MDVYQKTESLKLDLIEKDFKTEAKNIEDALVSGSMASEILGNLSLILENILLKLPKNETQLLKKTNSLLKEVSKIIR